MSTITTPKQVNSVLKDLSTSTEVEIVKKIRAIFERRGGFHKLQQRQIFVNTGSQNSLNPLSTGKSVQTLTTS